MLAVEWCKYHVDMFRYCGNKKQFVDVSQPDGRGAVGAVLHGFVIALYAYIACITIAILEFLVCGVTRAYVCAKSCKV